MTRSPERREPIFILGISGSPRAGGNTDLLLEEALRGARAAGARAEKIVANALRIAPCQECDRTRSDGTCRIRDDMREVYAKVAAADAIVVATPVFFGSVSAQLKILVDRFQCAWIARHRRGREPYDRERACAFICVAASERRDFFENARAVVRHFCATVRARCVEELFCGGLEAKGAVRGRPEALRRAREIGRRLAGGASRGRPAAPAT
ncbi:MAG: flavodoxin family protein [bacterium]|nr:flavodoxin family protein [bacterium]